MEREHCALLSRELGEQLAGTAPVATGWIAIEHTGPWTRQAPSAVELGATADHLQHEGVRLQLLRRVQSRHAPVPHPDGHTVLLAHAAVDPAARWIERLHVARPADLLDVDPAVVLSPVSPGLGEAVGHDVWLVCAHGRRDACCAVHGRPVAAALAAAGAEVWETTHTGGHRFAATAVVLPDGLSLGRLDTVDPVAVAADLSSGMVPAGLLRGRCALPQPPQAAEIALRSRLGTDLRDGVRVRGHHAGPPTTASDGPDDDAGTTTTVLLETPDGRWDATVTSGPAAHARPVSDGASPTRPAAHVVTRLARTTTAPPGPPVGTTVWIDEEKYPADQHWRFPGTVLGTDDHGTWLAVPAGAAAQRGDEPPRTMRSSFLVLVPHDEPWLVECYLEHPDVTTYMNIGTVPRWEGDRVTQLDLDIDVVRTHAGTVRVLDRDEFEERARTRDYPGALVAHAEAAAARAADLLTDEDPFGASAWLERLRADH